MKKLALALMCLVGVAFLSSCDPEEPVVQNPEPTITIMASEGFITGTVDNPTVIDLYEPVATKFGFKVESNAETNKQSGCNTLHLEGEVGSGLSSPTGLRL